MGSGAPPARSPSADGLVIARQGDPERRGGRPAASSSVPSDERPGSSSPILSPVRPLSMSALSMAVVGWSEGGGGVTGLMVWAGGTSGLAAMGPSSRKPNDTFSLSRQGAQEGSSDCGASAARPGAALLLRVRLPISP